MAKKVKLSPIHLQYWCRTSLIDEIVCKRRQVPFDKNLANAMEQTTRHYFVVDKKGNYEVVSGADFEAYFNDKEVEHKDRKPAPEMEMPTGVKLIIDTFIKEVHNV